MTQTINLTHAGCSLLWQESLPSERCFLQPESLCKHIQMKRKLECYLSILFKRIKTRRDVWTVTPPPVTFYREQPAFPTAGRSSAPTLYVLFRLQRPNIHSACELGINNSPINLNFIEINQSWPNHLIPAAGTESSTGRLNGLHHI